MSVCPRPSPPYPDIAECMNDGSLHSDIVIKSFLTEKWNSAFGFKFPTRCLFKKSLTENLLTNDVV
jgi:hypothetical protein